MILSRSLAKRRIAAEDRPGPFAAWWPVALDTLTILVLLALASGLVGTIAAEAGIDALWEIVGLYFLAFFVPFQAVVIVSTIWAVKSRWIGTETKGGGTR